MCFLNSQYAISSPLIAYGNVQFEPSIRLFDDHNRDKPHAVWEGEPAKGRRKEKERLMNKNQVIGGSKTFKEAPSITKKPESILPRSNNAACFV